MSKYIVSICDDDKLPYIIGVGAKNMEEAEQRFITRITNKYECLSVTSDWEDLCEDAFSHEIYISDPYDIEEFS